MYYTLSLRQNNDSLGKLSRDITALCGFNPFEHSSLQPQYSALQDLRRRCKLYGAVVMSFRLLKSEFSFTELPRRLGKAIKDVLDGK